MSDQNWKKYNITQDSVVKMTDTTKVRKTKLQQTIAFWLDESQESIIYIVIFYDSQYGLNTVLMN